MRANMRRDSEEEETKRRLRLRSKLVQRYGADPITGEQARYHPGAPYFLVTQEHDFYEPDRTKWKYRVAFYSRKSTYKPHLSKPRWTCNKTFKSLNSAVKECRSLDPHRAVVIRLLTNRNRGQEPVCLRV